MGVQATRAVFERSRQVGGARLVMLALAYHADDGGLCWPSVATLAAETGLTERAVQYALGRIEASGELRIEHGGGRGKPSRYVLTVQPAAPIGAERVQSASPIQAERVQSPAPITAERVKPTAPIAPGKGAIHAGKGANDDMERVQSAPPSPPTPPVTPGNRVPEPSTEPGTPLPRRDGGPTPGASNRVATFVDAVRTLGGEFTVSPRAARAIAASQAPPETLARLWVAAKNRAWLGRTDWAQSAPIWDLIERLDGFLEWERDATKGRAPNGAQGNGHAPPADAALAAKYGPVVRAARGG